jgi:hypothetical protein
LPLLQVIVGPALQRSEREVLEARLQALVAEWERLNE